jgi:mannose-1-phosphate guanylyltransferase
MELCAVILAGGRGERFWPLSRNHRPKQLLHLTGQETLLEAAVRRAGHSVPADRIWVVSGLDLKESIERMTLPVPAEQFIWEPVGRNTASAVGAAAERILQDGDAELLVMPSDHWIPDDGSFWDAVERGRRALSAFDGLMTFGLTPVYPETGYGYIERGEILVGGEGAYRAARFHEKPSAERAAEYLAGGGFYWNSGIFLFRASTAAAELRQHVPAMKAGLDGLRRDLAGGGGEVAWRRYFEGAPSLSFDHAVLEHSAKVAVIASDFGWSDLGNWTALGALMPRDDAGNRAQGSVLALESENCVLFSEPGGMLAVLGVKDLIVVRVGDATLVCPLDRAQDVRRLVAQGRTDELLRRFF